MMGMSLTIKKVIFHKPINEKLKYEWRRNKIRGHLPVIIYFVLLI